MSIRVKCPACAQTLKAEDRYAGRTVRCPGCREPLTIPAAPPPPPAEQSLDPFAEQVTSAPAPAEAPPVPAPPRPKKKSAKAPPIAPTPTIDEDEIGDLLSAGSPPPADEESPPEQGLPLQTPNWDGVASTYDLAEPDPPAATDGASLPPKVRKKKKKALNDSAIERRRPARDESGRRSEASPGRPWLIWALAIFLAPLAVSVVFPDKPVVERISEAVDANPELEQRLSELPDSSEDPLATLIGAFPDQRIPGAIFSRDTSWHLALALLSGVVFLGVILAIWPDEQVRPGYLVGMGVLTGTVSIAVLLGFQFIAEFSQNYTLVRGRGILAGLFYLVKFIGFSYRCAIDPTIGFGLSLMGFVFGVGLCEELCKAIPIVIYLKGRQTQTWRGAVAVGFASGIGFGVSEGISYSADMYNGIAGPMTYAVRFLSCVALHSIWAGIVGLLMYRDQSHLSEVEADDFFWFVVRYLGIAMLLHALYDVLLKFDHELLALAIAAGSFAWLLWLIRREEAEELSPA